MKRIFLTPINEWQQLKGKFNWYTLTIIHIEFENDCMHKGYELIVILLGFGFRLRYNTKESDEIFTHYDKLAEETMKDHNA